MKYFKSCSSIEEVKNLYKQLAKQHHPDKGGCNEIMQEINCEYSLVIARLLKGLNLTDSEIEFGILSSQKYQEAINAIISLPGLIVEVVGNWLWVTGSTFQHREILKTAGFVYSRPKKSWYFRTEEFRAKYSSPVDLDALRRIYGCTRISKVHSDSGLQLK